MKCPACGALLVRGRIMCSPCWESIPSKGSLRDTPHRNLQTLLFKLWRFGKPAAGFTEALTSAVDQVREVRARRSKAGLDKGNGGA